MANWRPVHASLWNDRRFLSCGDDARMLWLFLLTCPSLPIPGVILGGDASLAEMLGWTTERLRKQFAELSQTGLQVAREGRVVWLRNALKYQTPRNPNMLKGWAKKWDDVPEGRLKPEIWEALKIACKSWSILFGKLFAKPSPVCLRVCSSNSLDNSSAHDHDHYHQNDHENDLGERESSASLAYPVANGMGPNGEPPPPVAQQTAAEKPQRSAPRRALDPAWKPSRTESVLKSERAASARGVDVASELEGLRDWAIGDAVRKADWDATWRGWLRRARATQRNGARHAPTPLELQRERIAMLEREEQELNRDEA